MGGRVTHEQREQMVLDDLAANFPNFAGHAPAWSKVPDGRDLTYGRTCTLGGLTRRSSVVSRSWFIRQPKLYTCGKSPYIVLVLEGKAIFFRVSGFLRTGRRDASDGLTLKNATATLKLGYNFAIISLK